MGQPAKVAEHLTRIDASAHRHAELAVARHDPVSRLHGHGGSDLGGLLAQELSPETELALALQVERLLVSAADDHHLAIQVEQLLWAQPIRGERLLRHEVVLILRAVAPAELRGALAATL